MKTAIKSICFFAFFFLNACNVLKVRTYDENRKKEKPNGIPFYVQKQIIQQKTQYLYDWQEINFLKEEKKEEKTITTLLYTGRIKKGQYLVLKEIESLLDSDEINEENILEKIKELHIAPIIPSDNEKESIEKNILENSYNERVVVDYSKKYYLNAKMPWFGNSSLTQKINTNGTLSESTATSDSQLDELATALVGVATPIANVKIAEIAKETTSVVDEIVDGDLTEKQKYKLFSILNSSNIPKPLVKYKLKVSEKGYIYTFVKELKSSRKDSINLPIFFDLQKGNYTRTNWPVSSKVVTSKPKNTIGISATVTLPED